MILQVNSISLLEKLLKSQIQSAQCQARCQSLETQKDLRICLEVCKTVVDDPESEFSICKLPRLCSGACQVACQDDGVHSDKLTYVRQDQCKLFWNMEARAKNDIFLVSGVDLGGKINLISNGVKEMSLELTPILTKKYLEFTVIAVGSQGVSDIQSTKVKSTDTCNGVEDSESAYEVQNKTEDDMLEVVEVKKLENNNLFEIFVYSLLVAVFFVTVGIILLSPRKYAFSKIENVTEIV